MEGRLLLDVTGGRRVITVKTVSGWGNLLIRKSAAILKLLSSEDQSLLVGWNSGGRIGEESMADEPGRTSPFLVLNFGLDIINGV